MNQKYQVIIPKTFDPYWVGFILGDGCVYRYRGKPKGLHIALHSRDRTHLEKLQTYLKTDTPIRKAGINSRSSDIALYLRITREALAKKLIETGIYPNKSKTALVPNTMKFNRDFWRGLIDADGTLCIVEGKPYIGLYGTYDICRGFIDYIKFIFGKDFTKRQPIQNKSIYKVAFTRHAAKQILIHLYQDGDIALDRKMKLAQNFTKI